jgi:phytoene synthase
MLSRLDLDSALARCSEIVQRRPTHLGSAAAGLEDERRRALFLASYASMRVADDLIDEDYLTRPEAERRAQHPRVEAQLRLWLEQSELAAQGRFEVQPGSFEPELFQALNDQLGPTELGPDAWRRLAASLERDLAERPVESWDDFLLYCEGACIAPASVFVYIVAARFESDGSSHFPAATGPREFAQDLAIYSYLVHMRRDLLDDASRSAQLVLLPREWLRADGLGEAEAMACLRDGRLAELAGALNCLQEKTDHYRARALASIERAESILGTEAASSLRSIFQLYEATARRSG